MNKLWLILLMAQGAHAAVEPILIRTLTEVTGGGLSVSGSSVIVRGVYEIRKASISVASGTGFLVFSSTGAMLQCSINTPSPSATYDFEILTDDSEEFAIGGGSGFAGKSSLSFFRFIFGSHKAVISNASVDGIYRLRCVIKE